MSTSSYQLYVGIDIAAATAMVTWTGPQAPQPFLSDQTPAGYAALQQRLRETGIVPAQTLVVMEATGTYWVRLACALHQAGYQISVVNPKQARDFAKALLHRAKTDRVDAQVLAQLGAKLTPAHWTPPPAPYHELHQRLAHRDSLLALRQQVRNQQHALQQEQVMVATVQEWQASLIATFDAQLHQVEQELAQLVAADNE